MMNDAEKWDDFLALIDILQEKWASEADDTQAYREARAVRVFNAGTSTTIDVLPYCSTTIICRVKKMRDFLLRCNCAAVKVVNNHKEFPGAHRSWVEHILLFIVPRQIVELGDPARRSCDACESLGARMKKIIKHLTARNHIRPGETASQRCATSTRTGVTTSWQRIFNVGLLDTLSRRSPV